MALFPASILNDWRSGQDFRRRLWVIRQVPGRWEAQTIPISCSFCYKPVRFMRDITGYKMMKGYYFKLWIATICQKVLMRFMVFFFFNQPPLKHIKTRRPQQDTLDKIRHDSLSRSPGSGATQISNARSMLATGPSTDGDWICLHSRTTIQTSVYSFIYTYIHIYIYIHLSALHVIYRHIVKLSLSISILYMYYFYFLTIIISISIQSVYMYISIYFRYIYISMIYANNVCSINIKCAYMMYIHNMRIFISNQNVGKTS